MKAVTKYWIDETDADDIKLLAEIEVVGRPVIASVAQINPIKLGRFLKGLGSFTMHEVQDLKRAVAVSANALNAAKQAYQNA